MNGRSSSAAWSRRAALAATTWGLACLAGCRGARETARGRRGRRAVSLHDVTTEIVAALGAVDRLVGVSEPVDLAPEVARAVARVPRVQGLESIVAARADTVLGLGVVAEQDPALVAALRRAGVDVTLADPGTLDDVCALTRAVAARVGAVAAGEAVATRTRDAIERGTVRAARPRRVFVYDCCDPPFTAGGRAMLTELLRRAGGRNVFDDVDADWAHVSWELVLARRPELVVIHAYAMEGQGDVAAKRRALAAVPGLANVPCGVLPLGCSLGGLRSVEGLARLRAILADAAP